MSARRETGADVRPNPYDELPYDSTPIEWSAPERLALCSLLSGGPRAPRAGYRVLELGCGDGANLLPMAHHRQHASFVGVDGSRHAIDLSERRRDELGLTNLRFLHVDFAQLSAALEGPFDFILAHGVFSWVPDTVRDQLLAFCARQLGPEGLLYLNYNTRPGWTVRGLVRDFLRAQTAHIERLPERTQAAQKIAAAAAAAHAEDDHPYMQLMAREYRFVCDSQPSYVAHEFLAPENHAYWRSEFGALLAAHGLRALADADGTYASGRVPEELSDRILAVGWTGMPVQDSADLFTYRQLHSPVVCRESHTLRAAEAAELSALWLASPVEALSRTEAGVARFRHPDEREIEVRDDAVVAALSQLAPRWPSALPVAQLLAQPAQHTEDLRVLHHYGVVELRLGEPSSDPAREAELARCELHWKGYSTNRYHRPERLGGGHERG